MKIFSGFSIDAHHYRTKYSYEKPFLDDNCDAKINALAKKSRFKSYLKLCALSLPSRYPTNPDKH